MTAQAVVQSFPIKKGNEVTHKRWQLDVDAAASAAQISPVRLAQEAAEMAQHFPRWLLVMLRDEQPLQCRCDGLYVFEHGARCVQCYKPAPPLTRGMRAGWFGVMPPIGIDSLRRIKDALVAKPPKRHVVGTRAPIGTYVLVPLVVVYPSGYPHQPVEVHYLPEFRSIPGIPRDEYSHTIHMIGATRMCLFAPNQWATTMTCRETLQQRAYAHVVKFLNYANGKHNAFAIVS